MNSIQAPQDPPIPPVTAYKERGWLRRNWVEISIVVLGCAGIAAILSAHAFRGTDFIHADNAAHLGEFVGGFLGTLLALLSVALLFSTLKSQRDSFALQSFETRLSELIKMHRDNAAELELGRSRGRKVFVLLVREFRLILELVRRISEDRKQVLTDRELLRVAYYTLYYGVGPNSSRMLKSSLTDFPSDFVDTLVSALDTPALKQELRRQRKLGYLPFEGHQSRLGHYYRHLYQTVSYVDSQRIDIDKYEYAKTIRAQLTNHEQALLLINSLTPLGTNWWSRSFMGRYRMVQNIPRQFFDRTREIDVGKLFEGNYFEWQS